MIYFSIYACCIISSLLAMTKQFYKHRQMILFGIAIMLILLAGLRVDTGYDYDSYKAIFNNSPNLYQLIIYGNRINIETGYILINSIVKTIGGSFNLVLFVSASISVLIVTKSLTKYSVYPILSMLIYVSRFYFVRDMGQVRSSIACAIVLYSIKFINRKQLKEFTITILIACLFHSVALIGFLLYGFNLIKFKDYKYVYKLLLVSIIVSQLKVINLILKIVSNILPQYAVYINSEYYSLSNSLINPVLIMQILILIVFVYFRKAIEYKNENYKVILNGYLISTLILILLNDYYTLAGRLSTVFATFEILIIPMFVKYVFKDKDKIVVYILIILYCIVIFYLVFWSSSSHVYIPYRSILMRKGV